MTGERTLLRMNLSLFEGEKTEKPTSKKKRDARQKGQVAQSQEVGVAALFMLLFASIRMFAGYMYEHLVGIFKSTMGMIAYYDSYFEAEVFARLIFDLFMEIVVICLPIFAVALLAGIIVNVVQVGWHPTAEPMKPKFNKISPLQGIKRMFSSQALINFLKSMLKILFIGLVVYNAIMKRQNDALKLVYMNLGSSFSYVANAAVDLGLAVAAAYIVIAAVDYIYTRWKHTKSLKMSKQEVKDEWKQSEGDPQIKSKIRRKMLEAGMRRMMQEVPNADVIVTNPTHFAVALRYDRDKALPVPVVTAKGADFLAKRIKEKAAEFNVPIVENKPLARALYDTVDVGREIPPNLYAAVAEILSYVYRLKGIGKVS